MKCPHCGSKTEQGNILSTAPVQPEEAGKCHSCDTLVLRFAVIGEPDIVVRYCDMDPAESFSEFLDRMLDEHRKRSLN